MKLLFSPYQQHDSLSLPINAIIPAPMATDVERLELESAIFKSKEVFPGEESMNQIKPSYTAFRVSRL